MTPVSEESNEHRDVPRHRVLLAGRIVINALQSTYDVTLRDLGDEGVKIKLSDAVDIPARFVLLIKEPGTGTYTRRNCEKRWQHGNMVGARFTDPGH